jgi:hypothetical protein
MPRGLVGRMRPALGRGRGRANDPGRARQFHFEVPHRPWEIGHRYANACGCGRLGLSGTVGEDGHTVVQRNLAVADTGFCNTPSEIVGPTRIKSIYSSAHLDLVGISCQSRVIIALCRVDAQRESGTRKTDGRPRRPEERILIWGSQFGTLVLLTAVKKHQDRTDAVGQAGWRLMDKQCLSSRWYRSRELSRAEFSKASKKSMEGHERAGDSPQETSLVPVA